ncbi:MAG: SdpI family protein, partial [Gammaproteobacteria bacterium]
MTLKTVAFAHRNGCAAPYSSSTSDATAAASADRFPSKHSTRAVAASQHSAIRALSGGDGASVRYRLKISAADRALRPADAGHDGNPFIQGALLGDSNPGGVPGLRLPWTCRSRLAWEKAHRLMGRVLFAGGLVGLLSAPFVSFVTVFVGIAGVIVI